MRRMLAAMCAAGLLLVAGCGGDDGGDEEEDASTAESTTTSSAEGGEEGEGSAADGSTDGSAETTTTGGDAGGAGDTSTTDEGAAAAPGGHGEHAEFCESFMALASDATSGGDMTAVVEQLEAIGPPEEIADAWGRLQEMAAEIAETGPGEEPDPEYQEAANEIMTFVASNCAGSTPGDTVSTQS